MGMSIRTWWCCCMDQYDLPQYTLTLTSPPQWKHFNPSCKGSCSSGTHNVLAWPVNVLSPSIRASFVSMPDRYLTFSSHCFCSHHGVRTMFRLLRWVMNYSQLLACLILSLNLASARLYMFYWILSSSAVSSCSRWSHFSCILSPLYLTTHLTSLFSISFGPSYSLIGTPFTYQLLNFQPGL